jgi:hypothetical protein
MGFLFLDSIFKREKFKWNRGKEHKEIPSVRMKKEEDYDRIFCQLFS